jgi:hypothetical protein
MNTTRIDALGNRIATDALTTLVRMCPEVRNATPERQGAALGAMRAKIPEALDELLRDVQAAPGVYRAAYASALLTLVSAGVREIRGE